VNINATLDMIGAAALSSRATLHTSFRLAQSLYSGIWESQIPGDVVECGVFGGAHAAVMALALRGHWGSIGYPSNGRRVHLFDSFEGIPAAGEHDTNWTHPAGTSACSLEDVKRNMKQWGIDESLLVYHPGWFHETVASMQAPIALLRLDADLYESTRVCLEHLYPLVSPGGWVIVDDFALPGCRKAVDDYMQENFPPVYFQKP